jgi:hypothetical protein
MEKEFLPYELALRMKQLGFDEPCFGYYLETKEWTPASYSREGTVYPSNSNLLSDWVAAPTFSQAFRWFREKYFYISYVCAPYKEYDEFYFRIRYIGDVLNEGQLESCESQVYKTYEEAELACLEKLIEVVEQKNEN